MKLEPEYLEHLMRQALQQAALAAACGEVPVGAVIARGDEVLAAAHNEMEEGRDATRHAEVLAVQRASQRLGGWRLTDSVLCVTLEPCTMCAGAIRLARIPVVVYGAPDPKLGAFGSLYDLSQDDRLGPPPRVITGVLAEECAAQLQEFFRSKRARP
jgi:tRNA(adenine34) deaminase